MAFEKQLIRGAIVNLIGLVAKLVHPLFFVVITWLFGTEVVGLYFLATFIVEIGNSAVTSGYNDAATIFGSEHADDPDKAGAMRQVFGNAFTVTMGTSAVLIGLGLVGIQPLVDGLYSDKPLLADALWVLIWSLPATAVAQVTISATKSLMIMEYDTAFKGFVKPLALLGFSLVAWWLDAGIVGLMWAHLATQVLLAILGLWAYNRHFSIVETWREIRRFRFDREMLRFALPQNLNMTFSRYVTRLDVIMLGAFGFSNHELAFYGAAALITSNLREIKLIFSSALGPIIARHHAAGDRDAFIFDLSRVSRWTTTLIVPAVLGTLILRDDVLVLVDPGFVGDTLFVAILLAPPLLSCATGLAGNSIVWTRHSTWNLGNSMAVAVLNTLLNLWMIPWLGLTGAAMATAMASTLVSVAQMLELYHLERAYIRLSAVWKPWLGFGLGLAACIVFWDPADVATVGIRIALVVGMAIAYFGLMAVLDHPEVRSVMRLPRRRAA